MSTDPSKESDAVYQSHLLVARFLHAQGYSSTLSSFAAEAHSRHPALRLPALDSSSQSVEGDDWNDVVEEWIARRMTRLKVNDEGERIMDQLEGLEFENAVLPTKVETVVREGSNLLAVKKGVMPRKKWDSAELQFKSDTVPCILTTSVDRTLKLWSTSSRSFELLDSHSFSSPVLSFTQHPQPASARFVACGTMEGSLSIVDLVTREVVVKVKDHNKYIVCVAWSPDGNYLATLGHDKLVHVYSVSLSFPITSSSPSCDDAQAEADSPTVKLALAQTLHPRTSPEAAVFLPDSQWLVWTARDDHLLHYLGMPPPHPSSPSTSSANPAHTPSKPWELREHNLNPNLDTFVSFSILSLSVHPSLPLLSLQTSTAAARILLYPFHSSTRLLTIHTTAQQSDYFNPRHAWLPSGAAVCVNSEDGIVRIVDLKGKVRFAKGAHGIAAPVEDADDGASEEVRSERARARRELDRGSSVVRDVEAFEDEEAGSVVILSCGFDKTVKRLRR
ncbi:hypothetical protein JCM1841_006424 [Sporobolomyces salmonicolor]